MLVDIVADQGVADPRQRYAVAKAIVVLSFSGTTMASLQSALSQPGRVVAGGLTRAAAREALGLLAEHGGKGHEACAAGAVAPPAPPPGRPGPAPRGGRIPMWGLLVVAVAAGAAALIWSRPRHRQPAPLGAPPSKASVPAPLPSANGAGALTTREIAELAMPSTVSLRCGDSVGAGFFVAEELVLTNAHVVCRGDQFLKAHFRDGRKLAAELVAQDDWFDWAVLRVLGGAASPLPLGDATELGTGDRVIMIGSPRGLDFTAHEGIVSNVERKW